MTIISTTRFLRLVLILLPLVSALLAASPTADEDRQAHLLPLQRRDIICNPEPNQNIDLEDCHAALQQVPGGHGIGLPLGGIDPTSPNYLPREFIHGGCRIVIQLVPELTHAMLSWGMVRHRVGLLMNFCVGGLMDGRGGNDTYGGVQIGVGRV